MNWKNVKVVVTGAGGFIGSHLTEELARKGAKVKALVHYNSAGHWGFLEELSPEPVSVSFKFTLTFLPVKLFIQSGCRRCGTPDLLDLSVDLLDLCLQADLQIVRPSIELSYLLLEVAQVALADLAKKVVLLSTFVFRKGARCDREQAWRGLSTLLENNKRA